MQNKKWRLILASQSPRRREILESAGFSCMTFTSNSSESFDENLTLEENLCHIAEAKVQTVAGNLSVQKLKGSLILGADTVVILKETVFGKPKNSSEARRMLSQLSGKTHSVKTAFAIFCPDQVRGVTRVVTTRVGFRKLTTAEVKWYVDTGEPFDKAGGYGIQGLASQFVNSLDGDLLNVVGLPLFAVNQELERQGWRLLRKVNSGTHASKSKGKNRRR